MKKSIKKKWVKALRSGKYKQGHLLLYFKEYKSYCCLGVLRHIVKGKNRGVSANRGGLLSKPFLKEVGLDDITQEKLADMNDNCMPFNKIADYIEENL